LTYKTVSQITYSVLVETLNPAQSINQSISVGALCGLDCWCVQQQYWTSVAAADAALYPSFTRKFYKQPAGSVVCIKFSIVTLFLYANTAVTCITYQIDYKVKSQ